MEEKSETYNVVEVNTFSTDDDYMICACGECFHSDEDLKKHLIEKHASGDIKEEDDVPKQKENVCEFCNKSYTNVRALNIHRTHAHIGTKQKSSIVCPECGRTCSSRLALENHIRTHTGEKPFICPICSRGFNANLLLQMHVRIHTGERPYVCRLCPKAFASRSGLTRHKRVHTGDKPYECEICEKRFSQSNSCKLHYLTVHLKQPCPYKRKPRVKKPKSDSYEMDTYEVVESGEMDETEVVDEVAEVEMDESEIVNAVTNIEMDEYDEHGRDEMTEYEIVHKVDSHAKDQVYHTLETDEEVITIKEEVVDHSYVPKKETRRGPARDSNVRKVVFMNDNLQQGNNESPMRQLVLVRKESDKINKSEPATRTNFVNLKSTKDVSPNKAVFLKSGNAVKTFKVNKAVSPKKLNNSQHFNAVSIKLEKPEKKVYVEAAQRNVAPIKVAKPEEKKIVLNQKNFVPITMVNNKPLYVLKRGRLTPEAQKVVVLKNNAIVLQQSVKPTLELKSLPILRKAIPLKQHPHNFIKLK